MNFVLTCCLLPVSASVISSVISGNIALSLGMVGALSIVRFRHPVKTSLELSIYFLLVTAGVATSVSPEKAFVLVSSSLLIIFVYSIYSSRSSKLPDFMPSIIASGNEKSYLLDISSTNPIDLTKAHHSIVSTIENPDESFYNYKVSYSTLSEAQQFVESTRAIYPGIKTRIDLF